MQSGWALQAGTSHFLGQNFAKAFDVTFQNTKGEREFVWATSWGVSTRLVGAMIMTHSDDAGLILPPKVASLQVVIVPIWKTDAEKETTIAFSEQVKAALKGRFSVTIDSRDGLKPGAKYFDWERKGVPLRLEVGPRDVASNQVFAAARTGGKKEGMAFVGIADTVAAKLDAIQAELLRRAEERLQAAIRTVPDYATFKSELEKGGLFLQPWHDDAAHEATIKEETKATIRCYPLNLQGEIEGKTCFYSGRPATHMALFARAY
jgi:prolyl-tRNA synthetase